MGTAAFRRFRAIALTEGVSFLVLLGIAMPLKYLADLPQAVLVVGWIHGVLFILYMVALAGVARREAWPLGRVALAGIASVIPAGPFLIDARLRHAEADEPSS